MIYEKVTDKEKELLLEKRIDKINSDKEYARELFELWYKDDVQENINSWENLSEKQKMKICSHIIYMEDRAIITTAQKMFKIYQVRQKLQKINELKHIQLVHCEIRQDE